jgi:hypothetical protein
LRSLESLQKWITVRQFPIRSHSPAINEQRLVQVLEIARHLARVAQGPAYRHMQDALAELEDALSDHLAAIETAADDDKTDAEEGGDAERERRACYPLRAA